MLSNGQLKTVAVGADQRIPSSELRRLVEEVLNKLPRVLEDVITREEEKGLFLSLPMTQRKAPAAAASFVRAHWKR